MAGPGSLRSALVPSRVGAGPSRPAAGAAPRPRAARRHLALRVRADAAGRGEPDAKRGPRAAGEALIHSLADVHRASGRASSSVNVILGLDTSEAAWRCIDERVNTYPSLREFTAIGSGGSSFRDSMVSAVQAVVGRADAMPVSQRCSTGGRWISVTVGPVLVTSADDVLEVYQRMKTDSRLRYFL